MTRARSTMHQVRSIPWQPSCHPTARGPLTPDPGSPGRAPARPASLPGAIIRPVDQEEYVRAARAIRDANSPKDVMGVRSSVFERIADRRRPAHPAGGGRAGAAHGDRAPGARPSAG